MSGLDFGTVNFTPTAALSGGSCATSVWTSSTSAECFGAAVGSGATVLTVSGKVGTMGGGFSFDGAWAANKQLVYRGG